MKNKLTEKIRKNAEKEVQKDFAADWGVFWFITGEVVGKWTLGLLGWAADTMILFSILFAGTKRFWVSLVIAGVLCFILQLTSGSAVFKVAKGIRKGDYKNIAYRRSISVAIFYLLIALGASLWFSFNTKDVYEVAAQEALQAEVKDESEVLAYYDAKANEKENAKAEAIKGIESQIAKWEGVTWKGVPTRKAQSKIEDLQNQLTFAINRYDMQLIKIENERRDELANLRRSNAASVSEFKSKILKGGDTFRWVNIAINLLRVLLIVGLSITTVDMGVVNVDNKRQQQAPTPGTTPELVPVSNTNVVRSNRVANNVSAVELENIINAIRSEKKKLSQYKGRLKRGEGSAETQERNIKRCQDEIERLEGEKIKLMNI